MQEREYFEKHPRYMGLLAFGEETVSAIEQFTKLDPEDNVIVLGCGYGRECIQIAPFVKRVYGLDVSYTIIKKALAFTRKQGMENFVGVTVDTWERDISGGINLIYSMAVMQHLTRDLVLDYFKRLPKKLAPKGMMIIQFLEKFTDIYHDADVRVYEPQVSWTEVEIREMAAACGLVVEVKTIKATKIANWHWCCFKREAHDAPI